MYVGQVWSSCTKALLCCSLLGVEFGMLIVSPTTLYATIVYYIIYVSHCITLWSYVFFGCWVGLQQKRPTTSQLCGIFLAIATSMIHSGYGTFAFDMNLFFTNLRSVLHNQINWTPYELWVVRTSDGAYR